MKYLSLLPLLFSSMLANDFYYEFGKKVELKPKLQTQSVQTQKDVLEYETTEGKSVKFKNEILVQCKANAYCEDDFSDLAISNYEEIASGFFLIKVENAQNIFNLAQQLYLKDDIETAHPNYVKTRNRR